MTFPPRLHFAAGAIMLFAAVNAVAVMSGPAAARSWLLLCGVVAMAAALHSTALEAADLTPALLFSVPPLIALTGDGSPSWLIGPLAALLLAAAELNALGWEAEGAALPAAALRQRLLRLSVLSALGAVAGLAVYGAGTLQVGRGIVTAGAGAAALALLARLLLARPGAG